MSSIWKIRPGGGVGAQSTAELQALLLRQRGISLEGETTFFEPLYERDIHDPHELTGTRAAVDRLVVAAKRGERALVYGDYDADGIAGTAVLMSTLRDLGIAAVPYLPHRLEDGYGLNPEVLHRLDAEFDLLISVDCGISAVAEVAELAARDKDVIIVDHHLAPETLPAALAILHPALGAYPTPYLSGAGVAWKFSQALLRDKRFGRDFDSDHEKWLLDLCCLGTVADMVPLSGENRAIVSFGCEVLRRTRRPGVRLLVEAARRQGQVVDGEMISFRIAPLLNAAGRMDHAQPALDLLLATSEERAKELMAQLRRYNDARRRRSQTVLSEAEEHAAIDSPVIFAYSEGWPAGIVGLVAGRLSDKFSRPSVVIGNGGRHAVGSVRAPHGFNALEIMTTAQEHLLKLGGHQGAAGFSVAFDRVGDLREALLASNHSLPAAPVLVENADAILPAHLLDWNTLEMLERFQPYGEGNARPKFVLRNAVLMDWRPVGKAREHAKMTFEASGNLLEGIGFGLALDDDVRLLESGQMVDILFQLDRNDFRGQHSLQLLVKQVAAAGSVVIEEEQIAVL